MSWLKKALQKWLEIEPKRATVHNFMVKPLTPETARQVAESISLQTKQAARRS